MIKKYMKILCTALSMCLLTTAYAWDGSVTGAVVRIDITPRIEGNYDMRVYLSGYPALCSGGVNWAYINSNESNYNAVVAAMMTAKTTGSNVQLDTVNDAYNYCHIAYVILP